MPVDFLGIDISKSDFHAHLLQSGSSAKRTFPNTSAGYGQLQRWLRNRKASGVHACMEATGAYWIGLAANLYDHSVCVSVVNPARIKNFARSQMRRTKTDGVDAQIIAQFCQTQTPVLWKPPAKEILEIRAIVAYRNQLVAERHRVRQLASTIYEARVLRERTSSHIAALNDLIDGVDEQLHALIEQTPAIADAVQRLAGIPGVGQLSAAAIFAQLPLGQLRNSKAAAAYAGVCPSDRQSGTSIHGKSRLSKMGNADLRKALYMPAMSVLRTTSSLAQFAARLRSRGKPGKVIVAALMRKILTIAYAVLKSGKPYVEALSA